MTILYKSLVFKSHHRKQNNILKIIIHQNTIDKILQSDNNDLIEFINNIIKYRFIEENDLYNVFDKDRTIYLKYKQNIDFWKKILLQLPKIKLDGRIRKGEHKIDENLYLKVRNAERFDDQILELLKY